MEGKLSLHAFTGNDSANRKHFTAAATTLGDYGTTENLNPFFVAFQNFIVNVDGIADFKLWSFFLETGLLDQFHNQVAHTASASLMAAGGD